MALPQATPGLLSLKIRRTAESIATLDTRPALPGAAAAAGEPEIDHTEEKEKIFSLLEQQCFAFVAFRNQIQDARARQAGFIDSFRARAEGVGEKLNNLSRVLMQRVDALNQRITSLAEVVSPQPLFQQLVRAEGAGRITGVAASRGHLAVTCAHGMVVTIERSSGKVVSCVKPFEGDGLFSPRLVLVRDKLVWFALSSKRKLALCTPLESASSRCVGEGVECYDSAVSAGECVVVTGVTDAVQFAKLEWDDGGKLASMGVCGDVRGAVRHLACDVENGTVYAATSKRRLYLVSSETFDVIGNRSLDGLPMQMQLTQLFLVISVAPNEILFVGREKDKLTLQMKVSITAGLRHFACSRRCLIVLTKDQTVERRPLGCPENMELICNMDASDCDEDVYISTVYADGAYIFLAHDNALSVWR